MPRRYTVKKDDDLLELAERFNLTDSQLLAANPGVTSINPGVRLSIPGITSLSSADPYGRRPKHEYPPAETPPEREPSRPGGQQPYVPPYVPPVLEPSRPGRQQPYVPPVLEPSRPGGQRPYVPPPLEPSRVGAPQPYVPPPLEPSRPGAPPSLLEPSRAGGVPPIVQPQQPGRQAIIPAALQVAERVAPFLQRLFRRDVLFNQEVPPTERRPGEPTAGARFAPVYSQEQVRKGFQGLGETLAELRTREFRGARGTEFAEGFPKGSIEAPGPATIFGGAQGRETFTAGEIVAQQAEAALSQGKNGTQWVRYLMSDGNTRMFNWSWNEETTQEELLEQRASHVGQSLRASDRPQIILESDRKLLDLSTDEMQNMGYYWDEDKGHWVFGEIIEQPQTYGTSLPGWGGTYNYPRGGGGGAWSYPSYLPREQAAPYQSFVGRESGTPYQSFVGREQQGRIPQQAQTRAARFGAITWRI